MIRYGQMALAATLGLSPLSLYNISIFASVRIDFWLGRHYNRAGVRQWHLLELNKKAVEPITISLKANEKVRRSGRKLSNILEYRGQQRKK